MRRRPILGVAVVLLAACGSSGRASAPTALPARGAERAWWERTIVLPPSTVAASTTTTAPTATPTGASATTSPPAPPCEQEFRIPNDVLFGTDSDVLDDRGRAEVLALAAGPLVNATRVVVAGATDSRGSAEHNLDLSGRRADAVEAVLIGPGSVPASIVTTEAWGEGRPVADEQGPDPDTARALNRRVTVLATVACPLSTTND